MHLPAEPLHFKPLFYETIWGGQHLRTHFNKSIPDDKLIGESWEIAGFGNHQSIVSNGVLKGRTLSDLYEEYPEDLIGESTSTQPMFPLLVKFIDANDALSVQVHPDDRNARIRFGKPFGKTECWYIAEAGAKAALGIGFLKKLDSDELHTAIINGTLEKLLQIVPVHAGEVYFIPAGTVHAILGDVVIYEVQQSSDTTLRMYDWQRTDASGQPRPLHINDAIAVADLSGRKNYRIDPVVFYDAAQQTSRCIRVVCPYFAMEEYRCNKDESNLLIRHHSCRIVSIVNGSATLVWKDGRDILNKGSTVLIPAILENVSIIGREACTCLALFIPDMHQDIIEPLARNGFTPLQISQLGDMGNAAFQ